MTRPNDAEIPPIVHHEPNDDPPWVTLSGPVRVRDDRAQSGGPNSAPSSPRSSGDGPPVSQTVSSAPCLRDPASVASSRTYHTWRREPDWVKARAEPAGWAGELRGLAP